MTTLHLYELSEGIRNLMALMEEEGSGALCAALLTLPEWREVE